MVTPTSLNGACCAAAVPAISADVNNNAMIPFVFTEASLSSLNRFVQCAFKREPPPHTSTPVWVL
jgi:hypothetical protein